MFHLRWRRQLSLALAAAGLLSAAALPSSAAAASDACALPRTHTFSEGLLPTSTARPAGVGSYRTLVIPVDFSDQPGDALAYSTLSSAATAAGTRLGTLSDGDLSATFELTASSWLRMPQSLAAYKAASSNWQNNIKQQALLDVVSSLPSGGFSNYTFVAFIYAGGYPAGRATTAPSGTAFKGAIDANAPSASSGVLAHELLHLLDLPDLYTSPNDSAAPTHAYDIMSGVYVANTDWLLAYQQYKLGWLTDAQVLCASTTTTVNVSLTPIETSSSAVKAVMVPIDTRRALVVEARNATNAFWPTDCTAGVVISVVDVGLQTGNKPIQVQGPSGGTSCGTQPGGRGAWTTGTYTDASGATVTIGTKDASGRWPVSVKPSLNYGSSVRATNGLQAHWRLGEPAKIEGDIAAADVGYVFNAEGDPTRSGRATDGTGTMSYYDQPGALYNQADTAQNFDGTRLINVPDVVNSSTFSAEAWTKLGSSATTLRGVFGGNARVRLDVSATGARALAFRGSTLSAGVLVSSGLANANAWVQWVVVGDGTALRLYRNGVQIGTQAMSGTGTTILGGTIGSGSGAADSSRFEGLIDEVSFYDTALSSATITRHYNLGTTGAP